MFAISVSFQSQPVSLCIMDGPDWPSAFGGMRPLLLVNSNARFEIVSIAIRYAILYFLHVNYLNIIFLGYRCTKMVYVV